MSELTIVLFVLAVILTIVTLVGHGIWVLLSLIFGGARRTSSTAQKAAGRRACPRCGTSFSLNEFDCGVCGWPTKTASHTSQPALRAVRDQVDRLAQLGLLDKAAHNELVAAIAQQQQRVVPVEPPTISSETIAPAASLAGAIEKPTTAVVAGEEPSPVEMAAPLSLPERARRYATSREAALAEPVAPRAEALAEPAAPKPSRLLAAFMEEKNIRWGELVGGLLIVGCSIALVISFWSEIATRPLLKFGLFNGVTAALFGIGFYTDRRWKIHTTSHGVLLIATLLVPLNFLAIAAFTQASPPTDMFSIAGEILSFVVFAVLVFFAGRILVPYDAWYLVAGVMVPCLMLLIVRRFAGPESSLRLLYVLAGIPIATYVASTAIGLRRRWIRATGATGEHGQGDLAESNTPSPRHGESQATCPLPKGEGVINETEAHRVLMLLGLVSAATLMPLALLLYKVPPLQTTLHWLTPLVTICGLPALLTGLLFWRRMDRQLAGLQTAGLAVGVMGVVVMAATVVLAWPSPATLVPTALALAAVMTAVAIWFGIPAAHVPGGLALSAALLVAFHWWRGNVAWTLTESADLKNALFSAISGQALVPLVAIFGAAAWLLRRIGRREDGLMYGLVASITAAASLALLLWFGFARSGDPHNITLMLAVYTLAALGAGLWLGHSDLARAGAVLLLLTLAQAIAYRFHERWPLEHPWVVALLAHATIIVVAVSVMNLRSMLRGPSPLMTARRLDVLRSLVWSARVTSFAAAVWLGFTIGSTTAGALCAYLAWLAIVWMFLAGVDGSPLLFTLSQVAAALAIFSGVTAALGQREWYTAARHPWLDPWFLAAQGVALSVYCLVLNSARAGISEWWRRGTESVVETAQPTWLVTAGRLLNPPWPAVDRVLSVVLVGLVIAVTVYGAAPGFMQELSPTGVAGERVVTPIERFEVAGIPHDHASGERAWMLLAAVAATFFTSWRQRRDDWQLVALVVLAMAVCPLLAAQLESSVAVASALRWISAGFFALCSGGMWWIHGRRNEVASILNRPSRFWGARPVMSTNRRFGVVIRDLLVLFVGLVYVAMGTAVARAALVFNNTVAALDGPWVWLLVWALVAAVVGLMIPFVVWLPRPAAGDRSTTASRAWAGQARNLFFLLALAPAAVLLSFTIAKALDARPLVGPESGHWFQRIGYELSYGVPLAVIALVLVGYAFRDRSSAFAFAAGLLFNVVATIVVLLRLARGGGVLDAAAWITVAQVTAIVAGVVGLVWLGAFSLHRFDEPSPYPSLKGRRIGRWPALLVTQVALAAVLCAAYLAPATLRLAIEWSPLATLPTWVASAGSPWGWCAVALATVAALWLNWRRAFNQYSMSLFAAAVVSLISLTVLRTGRGDVSAYHALLAGCCAAAWLLPVATRGINRLIAGADVGEQSNAWSALPVRAFDVAAVWLALWEYSSQASWWVIGGLAAIAARNIVVAWHEGRRGSIWISAVLVVIATSSWWLDMARGGAALRDAGGVFAFFWINVLAVAAMAIISVVIERRHLGITTDAPRIRWGLAFHRFAAWAIAATLLLTTAVGLAADLMNDSFAVNWTLVWAAWAGGVAVAVACFWDPATRWPVPCLYCVGLVAVGLYLDGLDFRAPMFQWALALALAAYSLATSTLWSGRERLRRIAERWGADALPADFASSESSPRRICDRRDSATTGGHGWIVAANFLIGVGVVLLVAWIEQTMDAFTHRMVAAYAVGAQAFALGLLARGRVRTPLQYLALVWGVFFAIAFGWAWLPPSMPAPWLHRLVVTVAALAVVVVVYGFGLVKFLKRENEWTRAAARLMPPLAAIAAALILVVLAIETSAYKRNGEVPISTPALIAVGLALAGLAAAALVAALMPGRDPLGLSERGRTMYVYVAEALLALLFLHIRVTKPEWFSGWFLQFWPLIIMVIAFIGVGFGEFFQRRRQRVLSEPLQMTGALLPLLPVLGFWVVPSELRQVDYSLILLSVGGLYAALSVLQKSFLYGVLAAVAANGSLWYLLHHRDGLGIAEHPQLWLIPPALSALAAGYINRKRLTPQQSASLRYASAIVIYVSSTADIFINGVADAPWLPAVLAGLSILGVLAGIMLRVQSFLYLGIGFLIVSLMTIIWHAAIHQHQTWILWVAGIVTGVAIIALFGLFEKRRDDVLRVVEQLKQWEA